MYSESKPRHEMVKQCDHVEFIKASLYIIDRINAELNSKDNLQLLLIRQKPKIAAQRVVVKLLGPVKLKDKYQSEISSLQKKEKEQVKEVEQIKKQLDEGEKQVRELVQEIQSELSAKLKATVKITL